MITRRFRYLTTVALAAAALVAAPARAAVPQTIAFQGYLTDDAGQPLGGTVTLAAAIYAASSGGTALWTETHAGVPVNGGVFAIALGSVAPLNAAVARTSPRYLGLRVDGGAELPRTELRAAPFALRSQAADTVTGGIDLRGGARSGWLTTVDSNQQQMLILSDLATGTGPWLSLGVSPDFGVGEGGTMALYGELPEARAYLEANYFGAGLLSLYGISRSVHLSPASIGDASVQVPANAISRSEIEDEPGLASVNNTNFFTLSATPAPIVLRTITPPADGYVLAFGQCVARVAHTQGTGTSAAFGLSDDGLSFGYAQDVNVQIASGAAGGAYAVPVHLNGVFNATAHDALTIYLMGSLTSGNVEAEDLSLSLLFVPTSYGTASPTLAAEPGSEGQPERDPVSPAAIAAEQDEARRLADQRRRNEDAEKLAEHTARLAELETRLKELEQETRTR